MKTCCQEPLDEGHTRCTRYVLTNTIRVKETEFEQKKNMLGDMERDLAEKREQLNRTKEKARQLQNEAKKTCGNPEGLSEEKKRVIC